MTPTSPVSAIITACNRREKTLQTLKRIYECRPQPSEVLVHVDGGNRALATELGACFPSARILVSQEHLGPGGGRNLLISESCHELVASFDDDSYPLDGDFFSRVVRVSEDAPQAAILAATVIEPSSRTTREGPLIRSASFVGCGCIYRRRVFLSTAGYVPLPLAYGMEELDLAMRLHAMNQMIVHSPDLRVYHDTDLRHRFASPINAAVTTNAALLVYLRYPIILWPLGMVQMVGTIIDLIMQKRFGGVCSGIMNIPSECARQRAHRKPLTAASILSYLALRRRCDRENVAP